jgi:glycogen operon protein
MLSTLFLAQGVPMLYSGDEFRNTQFGNNNAYCQDNEISWLDWACAEKNADILRFTREIIAFRRAHPILRHKTFLTGTPRHGFTAPDISWHGLLPYQPDWTPESKIIACMLCGKYSWEDSETEDCDIFMAFNSGLGNRKIVLPDSPGENRWKRVIDTALESPHDIVPDNEAPVLDDNVYYLKKQSTLVLVSC